MNDLSKTALLLIGFQNDYFSPDGILYQVVEESSRVTGVVNNTLALLDKYIDKFALVLSTPIHFTQDYSELKNPIGILKVIAEVGAFKADSYGAQGIKEFDKYGKRIMQIPGKRGLNAFTHTELANVLNKNGINNIVLAGTVTSICIDSTARSAVELGFNVTVLNDCTSSRTPFEQSFYCEEVFPLYAKVCSHTELVNE
ncbi:MULTISPECIES: cysteine hydrolase [Pseudoalteromonas]|jgi:nicotinamidase-related amidase|uniref:cysteine hydrolase n=1 Tax=Pseudoalteromonas TaxID=53246 RepID=UPI0003D5B380|nr:MULTISPECIES: cysteine hydrolase [Pseudoalteromonas]ETJ47018.1 isochorismatase [Pseudoalteromonas agarivorans]ETJ49365.1 isochorismatase [Pseudoalteromonas agarivorans]MCQ8819602.1 cysteine hydrolase [Pseudoalteromonas agarivorans]MDC9507892.1 cysteine hydrolase [Pseudoalteromonas sp. Angola-4]MDC9528558.1 cysteine hydrolase [Pseudoalteromonas sp. Angola-7]|tara:strand:- start:355 stop:951 length:597 start_codon:yes stop_codon:yes gene_type:complete